MTPRERARVDGIIAAFWRTLTGYEQEVARQGKNVLQDFIEMGGRFASEGQKPEVVSGKAEVLRWLSDPRVEFFERYAVRLFQQLKPCARSVLVADYYYNRRYSGTGKQKGGRLTGDEIAQHLGISANAYRQKVKYSRARLLELDGQCPKKYNAGLQK